MGLNFYFYLGFQKNQGGYEIMKHTVDMFLLADYSLSDKMISYVSFLILVIKKVIWSIPLKIDN